MSDPEVRISDRNGNGVGTITISSGTLGRIFAGLVVAGLLSWATWLTVSVAETNSSRWTNVEGAALENRVDVAETSLAVLKETQSSINRELQRLNNNLEDMRKREIQ